MRDTDWKIIYTLYTQRNITKTADLLFMTQPNLTKRLQQIEDELGIIIVSRGRRGVAFTSEGEYLALRAKDILKIFEEIKHHMYQIDAGNSGIIKIGVSNSYGRFILPSLLQRYKLVFKNIDFNIITALSSDIVRLVHNKDVQVGFIRGDHPLHGEEKHLVAIDKGYIVSKNKITLEQLPYIPRIDYSMDSINKKLIDNWWFDNFSSPPLIGMNVDHVDTCREMVLNGLGYAVFLGKDFTYNDSSLHYLPMQTKNNVPVERKTWMIYNKNSYESRLIRNFIDYVKENFHP